MSRPKPPAPKPPATPSSTDDFAADLASINAGGDDFASDLGSDAFGADVAGTAPPETPTNGMAVVSGLAGAGAAAIPTLKALAERIATSPMVSAGMQRLSAGAGALNVGKLGYDLATGKSPIKSGLEAAKNEALRQGAKLAYRAATPVATGLGAEGVAGMAAPVSVPLAGGLAGVAGTAGFLGALQHDANRHVDIDYSKDTPDTSIARVLTDMMTSEANRGKTRDQRMDDPNDTMFAADDSTTVRPNGQPRQSGLVASVLALMGR